MRIGERGEKMRHKTFANKFLTVLPIVLALAFLLLSVFLCLCDGDSVAIAQDKPLFKVITQDNYNWELQKDGVVISSASGVFFDVNGVEYDVALRFGDKIRETLINDGIIDDSVSGYLEAYYDLEFEVPGLTTKLLNGVGSTSYTEKDDSKIIVEGVFENSIASSTLPPLLQYSEKGENNFRYCEAQPIGHGALFGKNIPVGVYDVRMIVVEEFEFDGAERSATHYGSTVTCEITKGAPPIVSNATTNIVYGEKVGDISLVSATFSDKDGEIEMYGAWTLAEIQTDEVFSDGVVADKILPVRDEPYTVMLDFEPSNKNYEKTQNVAVSVSVLPRDIIVRIGDAYSLIGEDLADISQVEYKVDEYDLVAGDSVDDLNISLYYQDGIDRNTEGQYYIYAKSDNKNYNLQCYSKNHTFWHGGGKYSVYATRILITADDGFEFEIYCGDGFVAMTITITRITAPADMFGKDELVAGYKITFSDYDGNEILPMGDYTIAWTKNVDGATWVCTDDMQMHDLPDTSSLALTPEYNKIYFVKEVIELPTVVEGEMLSTRNIVLIAICCLLALCIIVVVVAYAKRRRYLK